MTSFASVPGQGNPAEHPDIFRTLVETIADYAIVLLDVGGYVMSWNRGAERINGYTASEIIGSHFSRFHTEDAIARGWPHKELELAIRHGRLEDEGWRVRKDGSQYWANVVITPLRDDTGRIIGFATVKRDMTERMQDAAKLREREETFRLLVQNVYDYAIFMLDPHGIVVSWNAGAARIKGYLSNEIVGQHFSRFYLPEDVASGKPAELLEIARTQGRVQGEGWRVRKDGSLFWAGVTLTAIYDDHQQLRGFAKITRDMSERKHLEEVEASARRMNEFLATLGHELRNPLAPMFNATSIMERAPEDAALVKANLGVVSRQLRHLARLVDDLLDVGRIAAGKLELRRLVIPIREVVAAAIEGSRPIIEGKSQKLVFNLADTDFLVRGDLVRLSQVIQNVLINASKFSPVGGTIALRSSISGHIGSIEIVDEGCGIPSESLDDIFRLFVQAKAPVHATSSGLGIGLSLCRSIVELHSGSISATSPGPGMGSTFTIRLPIVTENEHMVVPVATNPAKSLRILVVDDNRDAADSLGLLLQMSGHATVIVYDGVSAIRGVSDFVPDVALIDLAMPDMDGFELIKELREFAKLKHTRFYALTGFGETAVRGQVEQAGFHGHVVKPIDIEGLMAILGQLDSARAPST